MMVRRAFADHRACYGILRTSDRRQQALGVNQENQDTLRRNGNGNNSSSSAGIRGRRSPCKRLAKPRSQQRAILIGYLPALTGPSSSTGLASTAESIAVQEINAAGGIDGRQIELITRDTQSDPTKAVNGAPSSPTGRR